MILKSIIKKNMSQRFDPIKYGLPPDFVLTNYSKLKGWGCKVNKNQLQNLLKILDKPQNISEYNGNNIFNELKSGKITKNANNKFSPLGALSPDCAIEPLNDEFSMISTVDFFYPLIEDPYLMGKISVSNVLSDIYSIGATNINHFLVNLAISSDILKLKNGNIIGELMLEGIQDQVHKAGAMIKGGQTIINPSPIWGGTAVSIDYTKKLLKNNNASEGDVIYITKPLGIQIISNLSQWKKNKTEKYNILQASNKDNKIDELEEQFIASMLHLNKVSSEIMVKYNAKCCTDITGFGILGHLENLMHLQINDIDFEITQLPVFQNLLKFSNVLENFNFIKGRSAETSGGLVIILPKNKEKEFISEMESKNELAFKIGEVKKGSKKVNFTNIELKECLFK